MPACVSDFLPLEDFGISHSLFPLLLFRHERGWLCPSPIYSQRQSLDSMGALPYRQHTGASATFRMLIQCQHKGLVLGCLSWLAGMFREFLGFLSVPVVTTASHV